MLHTLKDKQEETRFKKQYQRHLFGKIKMNILSFKEKWYIASCIKV